MYMYVYVYVYILAEVGHLKEWMMRREAEVLDLRAKEGARIKVSCVGLSNKEQLLRRNVKRFRGGLIFKAHRRFLKAYRLLRRAQAPDGVDDAA